MGYFVSMIAVWSPNRQEVLSALRVQQTKKAYRLHWSGLFSRQRKGICVSPSGWTLLLGFGERPDEWRLKRASGLGLTLTSFISTHTDSSEVRAFEGGREVWAVTRDPDRYGEDRLEVHGDVPSTFSDIFERRWAQHAAGEPEAYVLPDGEEVPVAHDWLMEVPPDLAASVCGVRPDFMLTGDASELDFSSVRLLGRPKPTTPFIHRLKVGLDRGRRVYRDARAESRARLAREEDLNR